MRMLVLTLLLVQDVPAKSKELVEAVSGERMLATVQKLASFKSRYVGSPQDHETEGIGAAYRWIHQEFESIAKTAKLPAVVAYHDFETANARQAGNHTCKNVYLWLKGKKHPGRVVVFGGHYDSIHYVDRRPQKDAEAPGANDNASGTSAVLELARLFAPREFETGIIFIAFSGEELGLLGARAFVKELKEKNLEVVAMLNNDTIGSARGPDGRQQKGSLRCYSAPPEDSASRRMARWAKHVVESSVKDLTVTVHDRIDRPGRGGDHQPFSDAGHAAVRFIESVEDVRNQHNDKDRAELVDAEYLRKVAQADAAVVAALADALPPPALRETLEWNAVEGAQSYLLFVRTANDQFKTIDTRGKTSWTLSETGRVCVSSVNAQGVVGLPSAEIELK